jgi:hypothetical protein
LHLETNLIAASKLKRYAWCGFYSLIVFWGLNAYVLLSQYFRNNQLFEDPKNSAITDFVSWYNAALVAAAAQKAQVFIYDPAVQLESMKHMLSPFVPKDDYYLDYPPPFFALVRPLAGLGMENAWVLWCLIATIPIGIALWFLSKKFSGRFSRAFFITGTLASYPCWYAFFEGQTTLYQFPAHAAFWLLIQAENYFLAGILSGFIAIKLQYAPLILLVGLIRGRLKYLYGLLVGGSTLTFLSAVVVGWHNIISYPKSILYGESLLNTGAVVMQNFRGELLLLVGGDTKFVHQSALLVYAASLAAVGYVWLVVFPRLKKLTDKQGYDACVAFTVACMLTTSLHTHIPDYLFAATLAAFIYPLADQDMTKKLGLWVKILVLGFPVYSWAATMTMVCFVMLKVQPFFLWAAILLLLSALHLHSLWRLAGKPAMKPRAGD